MTDDLKTLAEVLGYKFADDALLRLALTHASAGAGNNERLEFLGDSVLGLVIAGVLYTRYPNLGEGALSRIRAHLVRRQTLASLARSIRLGSMLVLGEGEQRSGGQDRESIIANALEAVLGAVYLEGGYAATERVVLRLYRDLLAAIAPGEVDKDPKTELQERLQKEGLSTPHYRTVSIGGVAHRQRFEVECIVAGGLPRGHGVGGSRRQAEQEAAADVLAHWPKPA